MPNNTSSTKKGNSNNSSLLSRNSNYGGAYELKLEQVSTTQTSTTYALRLCGYVLNDLSDSTSAIWLCTSPFKTGHGIQITIDKGISDSQNSEKISHIISEKIANKEHWISEANKQYTNMNKCFHHTEKLAASRNFNILGTPFMAVFCIGTSPVILLIDSQTDLDSAVQSKLTSYQLLLQNIDSLLSANKITEDMTKIADITMSLRTIFNLGRSDINSLALVNENSPRSTILENILADNFWNDVEYPLVNDTRK
jgi:hypothetical protein